MTRSITLVFAFVCVLLMTSVLQGCGGGSGTSKAAGTYELDRAAMKAELQTKIDGMEDPTEQFMATSLLQGIDNIPKMTFVLAKDGSFEATSEFMGSKDTAKGNWSMKESTITFTMTETEPGDPESMIGTLRGDTIELTPPAGADMPFNLLFQKKKA